MTYRANEIRYVADDPELPTPRREAAAWALDRIRELEAALTRANALLTPPAEWRIVTRDMIESWPPEELQWLAGDTPLVEVDRAQARIRELEATLVKARADALEEAAQFCDESRAGTYWAKEIRAMKGQTDEARIRELEALVDAASRVASDGEAMNCLSASEYLAFRTALAAAIRALKGQTDEAPNS